MSNGGNFTLRDNYPWWNFWSKRNDRPTGLFRNSEKRATAMEGPVSSGSESLPALNSDQALQVTAVLAAVRAISQGLAQTPMLLVRRAWDASKSRFTYTPVPAHPLWFPLVESPNDYMTMFEFKEAMGIYAAFRGNAYAYVNDVIPSRVELIPLPPDDVTVVSRPDNEIVYEVRVEGGEILRLPRRKVVHLKGPQLGGAIGADILAYAAGAVGLAARAEKSHTEVIARRGRVDGVVSTDLPIDDQNTAEKIRKSFTANFGPGGKGGVAFLDQGVKFSRFTDTPSDMQLIEHRRFQVDEIGRAFGVFSQILNQAQDSSSYGSAEQTWQAHHKHTIDPWVQRYCQAIKLSVIGFDGQLGNLMLMPQQAFMALAGIKDMGDFLRTAHTIGLLTPNEMRGMLGLNPLENEPGADRPLTQLNMKLGYEDKEPEVAEPPGVQVQPGADAAREGGATGQPDAEQPASG